LLEIDAIRVVPAGATDPSARDVELDVRVEAAKGYFVRSLARDLAEGLGTLGHLTALRRVRSGPFGIEEAIALDAITPAGLLPLATAAARSLPVTRLDEEGVRAASFGQRVPHAHMNERHPGPSAWLDRAGHLVAIGERDPDGSGRVLRGFQRRPSMP
jgi:tRNA pseudouridine55 synthase